MDGDDAEQHEEGPYGRGHDGDLHGLCGQRQYQHVGALATVERGFGGVAVFGERHRVRRRLGEERAHARPVLELLDGRDVAGRPRQQEAATGDDEHEQRGDEGDPGQARHHLPRLARQEHRDGDQQQQRHGARGDRTQQTQLDTEAPEHEAADRHDSVAGGDVDDGEGGQADRDRADRIRDIAFDHDRDGQWDTDEQHQLDEADVLGPLEQAAPAHPVDAHQQGEDTRDSPGDEEHRETGPELALEAQLGGDPDHEQHDQGRERTGPHVGRRPVVVDEMWDTTTDEPALDRLTIRARRHRVGG